MKVQDDGIFLSFIKDILFSSTTVNKSKSREYFKYSLLSKLNSNLPSPFIHTISNTVSPYKIRINYGVKIVELVINSII